MSLLNAINMPQGVRLVREINERPHYYMYEFVVGGKTAFFDRNAAVRNRQPWSSPGLGVDVDGGYGAWRRGEGGTEIIPRSMQTNTCVGVFAGTYVEFGLTTILPL